MPVVYFTDPQVKKQHPFTIVFKYYPPGGAFQKKVLFTGADLQGPDLEMYFREEEIEKIRGGLRAVFGYGPYDKKTIRKIMKENRDNIPIEY